MLLINQAAKERHIAYYRLTSIYHPELVKALFYNCAVPCKQIGDFHSDHYHTNSKTDAYLLHSSLVDPQVG